MLFLKKLNYCQKIIETLSELEKKLYLCHKFKNLTVNVSFIRLTVYS